MLNDVDFAEEFKEEKEAQLYGKERIVQDLKFKHGQRTCRGEDHLHLHGRECLIDPLAD